MKEDDESTLSKDLLVSAVICTRSPLPINGLHHYPLISYPLSNKHYPLMSVLTPFLTKIFLPLTIFPNVFCLCSPVAQLPFGLEST